MQLHVPTLTCPSYKLLHMPIRRHTMTTGRLSSHCHCRSKFGLGFFKETNLQGGIKEHQSSRQHCRQLSISRGTRCLVSCISATMGSPTGNYHVCRASTLRMQSARWLPPADNCKTPRNSLPGGGGAMQQLQVASTGTLRPAFTNNARHDCKTSPRHGNIDLFLLTCGSYPVHAVGLPRSLHPARSLAASSCLRTSQAARPTSTTSPT